MGLVFFGIFAAVVAKAEPIQFQSSERQTSLLELYTSEGCSSCPPAEKWLSGMKSESGLWTDFVPVAFHVDYWNSLGWRDRWSSEKFSDRQRVYAQAWGSENIYTPELVLNGKEWSNWFDWKGARQDGQSAGRFESQFRGREAMGRHVCSGATGQHNLRSPRGFAREWREF